MPRGGCCANFATVKAKAGVGAFRYRSPMTPSEPPSDIPDYIRAIWRDPPPGRLMGPGHPAGDMLEGPDWRVLEESEGRVVVDVPLVSSLKNFRGQLFGGFAPAYIDLVALRTVSAGARQRPHGWLLTLNMRVEYLEPVEGPRFVIESRIVNRRGRSFLMEVVFRDQAGKMLLFSTLTLLEQPRATTAANP
jgi:acyl-coenzyme A thioesterase PaaI-like protein